ncbi:hypothetical protein FBR02_20405 [Anaerolineae bacterium CFX9]|nr:hypothetical protein [Anaerolineae bacterium CFX9]
MEAVFGLIGVIIGAVLTAVVTFLTTQATLDSSRRKARQDYLTSRMDMLAKSLAEYEVWLSRVGGYNSPSGDRNEISEHARIIGEAIAICLSVNDLPGRNDKKLADHESLPDVPYQPKTGIHEIHRLAYIANRRLTRNFVTQETQGAGGQKEIDTWGHYQDRNRSALDHAVKRLAQLIEETQSKG